MQPEPCPLILGGKGFIRQGSSGRLITSTGLEACDPAASWATLAFSLCMRGSQGSPWCFYSLSWCLSLRALRSLTPHLACHQESLSLFYLRHLKCHRASGTLLVEGTDFPMSSPASFTRSAPPPLWLAVTRAGGGDARETEIHPVRVFHSIEEGFSGTKEFLELLCTLPRCILLGHSSCECQPYKLPLNPKLVLLPSLSVPSTSYCR